VDRTFSHSSLLRYTPSRVWDANAKFAFDWADGDAGSRTQWTLEQGFVYRFFKYEGVARKIAEMEESLTLETYDRGDSNDSLLTTVYLIGTCYPTRPSRFGAKIAYRRLEDVNVFIPSLYAAYELSKFQLSLEYEYGLRTDGNDAPERRESRWEVAVKRVF